MELDQLDNENILKIKKIGNNTLVFYQLTEYILSVILFYNEYIIRSKIYVLAHEKKLNKQIVKSANHDFKMWKNERYKKNEDLKESQ